MGNGERGGEGLRLDPSIPHSPLPHFPPSRLITHHGDTMHEAVIVSAVRSAVGKGKSDGALANVHPVDLSAVVLREAVARAGVEPAAVDDVLWGCAMPEGAQGLNVARMAVLRAGFPVE